MILDVMTTCNSTAFSLILPIIKRALNLIQIIVPILLIIMIIIQLVSMIMKSDDKKDIKKIINKVIAAIIIFLIPVFINAIMGLVGESTEFSNCWNKADANKKNSVSEYKNTGNNKNKSKIIIDEDYEKGGEDTSNNNSNNNNTSISKIVFVGDSRTVQMYAYNTGDWTNADYSKGGVHEVGSDVYIAQTSKGLDWLKNTGMPAATNYLSSGTALVILMGVNDTYNADAYISYLKNNVSSWTGKGAKVYYSAVTPCDGSYASNNTKIEEFNSKLKSNLPSGVTWIDSYSNLKSAGFSTTDGLHYSENSSNTIYNYIKSAV